MEIINTGKAIARDEQPLSKIEMLYEFRERYKICERCHMRSPDHQGATISVSRHDNG